jgi:protein gp37
MAGASDIEWTDATWNPVAGCTIISPGCTNCYAMRMAARLDAMGLEKYAGTTRKSGGRAIWTGQVRLDVASLSAPSKWRKPRRVFVNSMADLFHERVPFEFVHLVWDAMEQASQHSFQVLTKRPDRLSEFLNSRPCRAPNVWVGASVESADYLWRVDDLRQANASVKFVSFEPLLGRIKSPKLVGIDWIIVGGESGPGARPMEPRWVEDLHSAARRYKTAFFFKQWGGPQKKRTGRTFKGQEWSEFPSMKGSHSVAA